MNSILKRYIFESGLDVIAPLKCGTRWLEGLDVENHTHCYSFDVIELSSHIHSGTTFIWRGVREHFLSAIKTELAIYPEKTPLDIATEMESGICDHWYPYLYKELYTLWSKTPFQFYKLRALSLLTPSASEMEYISTLYHFSLPTQWKSVEEVLSSLSPKHIIRLEKLISEEEKWLKLMIEPQYNKKNWEEYSDLEDEVLDIKCKIMDMEAEVSDLQTKIRELMKSNTKLQAKLDYTESVIGKLPTKLI